MDLRKILEEIKDYVFPVYCLECRKEGEWLCKKCFDKIDISGVFCCPHCHKNTKEGGYCFACSKDLCLVSSFAIVVYKEDGLIGEIIQILKYNYAEDILIVFEKLINNFVKQNQSLFSQIDLVVPIPLHKKRFVERGFNQAKLIAEIVAREINKPCREVITRSRHTLQQAKLRRDERLENIKDAFKIVDSVQGSILLVDDVFTTGTTLQECAKVLKEGGARSVTGFTVARG